MKARILLKADASDAGEGWSDSEIAAALDTVSVSQWPPTGLAVWRVRCAGLV
jgi:hypothetical protein